ncbi:NAD(P)-dependent oxidoreductase [uncultured Tateyamaria sp.]|uniref:NAD-dependent epimerase/dehydratase family protein n=1 Tax=uncultured Tateyamaria sp. TaxID=455651 RepID=UPI00261D2E50|nr:NAD(P)-dependent oxidoreductase [uncultured Tateyamaria sp.]
MASILITGGTGFVGAHLVRACLARGDRVTVLARAGSSLARLDGMRPRIALLRADFADVGSVRQALRVAKADVIFHLGATTRYVAQDDLGDTAQSLEDNLSPLVTLVAAACDVPPAVLVRSGTIAEYGDVAIPYDERLREAPRGAYAASMCAATHYLQSVRARLPYAAITVRLALTYGPMQNPDFLIPQLIRACQGGKRLTLHRPLDRRDMIHIDDVVAGLLAVADAGHAAPDLVNLSTGQAPTMAQLGRDVLRACGARPALLTQKTQTTPATELIASAALAQQTLGWSARIPLEEGLKRTLEWTPSHATPPRRTPAAQLTQTGAA